MVTKRLNKMAAKRKLTEDFNLRSTVEADHAKVGGVIAILSPVKKGKKKDYFEGKLSDGDISMRLVGFDPSQRDKLNSFHEKQESVELQDCEVKRDAKSNELEIFLKPSTKVTTSPKKI